MGCSRVLGLVMLALAVAACTPDYNWRQAGADDAAAMILLPARPAVMSRPIDLDGLAVEMSMRGARVGEQTFTLAWVDLPDAEEATRAHAIAAMASGMLRNIEAREISREPQAVPVVDWGGARTGSVPGIAVSARGERPAPGASMRAIFVARDARAWQAVVIGAPLDAEAAALFLESLALREP